MNKKNLISFVRQAILKSEAVADNQRILHFQRVGQAVGYAFDTLLSQIKLDEAGRSKMEAYYVKHYYNQPVSESSGYRYFGVSDDIVPVGEGRGIWYVQPSGGASPLPYSHRPSIAMFANLAVGEVMNQTFWRFGNIATKRQIVIENIGNSPLADIRSVDYGIVRAFASYEDTEEILIADGRVDLVIQMSVAWLSGGYVDKTNNNV